MLKDTYPLYLNNKAAQPNTDLEVTDKFTGEVAFRVALADAGDDRRSASPAPCARPSRWRGWRATSGRRVLDHCVDALPASGSTSWPMRCASRPASRSRTAEGEVTRLIDTFRIAAEESVRDDRRGPAARHLARAPRAIMGMWKRVPIGPCCFISPFNFPLNLAAHKIAPAIAVGCPFVMKPASRTPLGAIIMGEVLAETDSARGRLLDPAGAPRRAPTCSPPTSG